MRVGRPLGFGRLPNEAKNAAFAVPAGLLVYPQYVHHEHVEPRHTRQQVKTGTGGYLERSDDGYARASDEPFRNHPTFTNSRGRRPGRTTRA